MRRRASWRLLILIVTTLPCAAEVLTPEILIEQVRLHHPVMIRARLTAARAEAERLEKQGAFDARLKGRTRYLRYNSSSAVGAVQKVLESSFSVDFLTRYGIAVSTGFKRAAGDIKTPVSPTGESGEYFLEVTVPLLRNLGENPKAAAESQAFLKESLARLKVRRTELKLLEDTLKRYWTWVGAKHKLAVEERLLQLAKERLSAVENKIRSGLLPRIDRVEADREVQRRLGRVRKARRVLQKSAYALSVFLWREELQPDGVPEPEQAPSPMPPPRPLTPERVEAGKLTALTRRPELRLLKLAQDIAAIDRELARNQLLPRLDLVLWQGWQTGADAIEGPVIKAGVQLELPVLRRGAKGRLRQALLDLANLNAQEKQTLRRILIEIQDWASEIQAAYDRYRAARDELRLARALEAGEKKAFDLGDSTLFLVNRRERASGEANVKLIDVLVEYHQAVAGFLAATTELAGETPAAQNGNPVSQAISPPIPRLNEPMAN